MCVTLQYKFWWQYRKGLAQRRDNEQLLCHERIDDLQGDLFVFVRNNYDTSGAVVFCFFNG